MTTTKRKTNVQVVKQMMEHSAYGALAQIFIMDALAKHSKAVSETDPSKFESGLISGAAWVGVAKEIHKTLGDHFKQ
jgi:hypothetical protein